MKIIAVDDEMIALNGLQSSIRKAIPEAQIFCFDRAVQAFAFHEKNPCDVAFIDIHMGDMNGLELARRLKKHKKNINIVFVTGCQRYMKDAFDMFASGYIMKPASAEK